MRDEDREILPGLYVQQPDDVRLIGDAWSPDCCFPDDVREARRRVARLEAQEQARRFRARRRQLRWRQRARRREEDSGDEDDDDEDDDDDDSVPDDGEQNVDDYDIVKAAEDGERQTMGQVVREDRFRIWLRQRRRERRAKLFWKRLQIIRMDRYIRTGSLAQSCYYR